jgi:hypothetical protein
MQSLEGLTPSLEREISLPNNMEPRFLPAFRLELKTQLSLDCKLADLRLILTHQYYWVSNESILQNKSLPGEKGPVWGLVPVEGEGYKERCRRVNMVEYYVLVLSEKNETC